MISALSSKLLIVTSVSTAWGRALETLGRGDGGLSQTTTQQPGVCLDPILLVAHFHFRQMLQVNQCHRLNSMNQIVTRSTPENKIEWFAGFYPGYQIVSLFGFSRSRTQCVWIFFKVRDALTQRACIWRQLPGLHLPRSPFSSRDFLLSLSIGYQQCTAMTVLSLPCKEYFVWDKTTDTIKCKKKEKKKHLKKKPVLKPNDGAATRRAATLIDWLCGDKVSAEGHISLSARRWQHHAEERVGPSQ